MDDIPYYTAVIDTGKLFTFWLKKGLELKTILISVENQLESTYGPFTSKLSNHLGINDTLGLKSPDMYWNGVSDTLNLVKNFLIWKKQTNSPRSVNNFIEEVITKSQLRLTPKESPLFNELGISFETEFSLDIEEENVLKTSDEKNQIKIESFQDLLMSNFENEKPQPEEKKVTSSHKKEILDNNEFLDQFIRDSTTPREIKEKVDIPEKHFLRSALDELNNTEIMDSDDEEENSKIDIKIKDTSNWKNNFQPIEESKNTISESIDSNEEKKFLEELTINEDDDESKLLSSSLRDALRMLREEE